MPPEALGGGSVPIAETAPEPRRGPARSPFDADVPNFRVLVRLDTNADNPDERAFGFSRASTGDAAHARWILASEP
jgi:hypothetical protein